MTTFRDALLAEIAEQKQLISRLDNHEFGPGIMAQIRAERLALLERLLELEPEVDTEQAVAQDATLAIEELKNIVNAHRFDHEHFADDSEFADWVLSRARYTLGLIERGERLCRQVREP